MYVFAPNQTVEKFPYSIGHLRRDFPNTSFPRNPDEQLLAEYNVFPVAERSAPVFHEATENCNQVAPTFQDGQWVMTWLVTSATDDEVAERAAFKASQVRADRNARLSSSDWTQLSDAPVSAAPWAAYRQALRDITGQAGFPWDITWPEEPA